MWAGDRNPSPVPPLLNPIEAERFSQLNSELQTFRVEAHPAFSTRTLHALPAGVQDTAAASLLHNFPPCAEALSQEKTTLRLEEC